MASNNTAGGGISFLGLLFITFLVLKLTEVIDWSWWWVTAPLWGGIALIAVLCVIFVIAFTISIIVNIIRKRK